MAQRQAPNAEVELVVLPRTRDLGNDVQVRRALPARERRLVGPFIFFDDFGPTVLSAGRGMDVRPHPHIGLATVTFLFDGELLHRDSLGMVQPIRAGEVNWMTAGQGIVHSERTPPAQRLGGARLWGIQSWVALPLAHEEDAPSFEHVAADKLPRLEGEGVHAQLIAGSLFGHTSPVRTYTGMFYVHALLNPGAELALPPSYEERAAYVVEGSLELPPYPESYGPSQLVIFRRGETARLLARGPGATRVMLLGGEPMDGPRHIEWNFVSSSKERITQAKADWRAARFGRVPGETDFIPLPGDPEPPVVSYP